MKNLEVKTYSLDTNEIVCYAKLYCENMIELYDKDIENAIENNKSVKTMASIREKYIQKYFELAYLQQEVEHEIQKAPWED